MKIKLIETGEIEEVSELWGERLFEQGKAEIIGRESKPAKAEVTVTDKLPEGADDAKDGAKAETVKKAGKKR